LLKATGAALVETIMDSISLDCINFVAPRAVAAAARVVVCLSLYTIMPSLCIPVCGAHPLNGAAQDADITVNTSGEAKLYHREGCSLLAEPKAALALSVAVDQGYQPCSVCVPLRATALKWTFRVKVTVTATESLREAVVSSVTRELQSLGDVLVVDQGPAFHLKILVLESASKGKPAGDAALAFLVTKPLEDTAGKQGPSCELILNHHLEIGPLDGLQRMAARFIRDFDSRVLAESRRMRQK
jgi:hypothetical protein